MDLNTKGVGKTVVSPHGVTAKRKRVETLLKVRNSIPRSQVKNPTKVLGFLLGSLIFA